MFCLHGMSQDKIFRLGVSQVWSTQSGEKTELPLALPPLSLLVVVVAVVARANLKARVCAKRVCHPRQGPAKVAKTQPEMKSTMLIHGLLWCVQCTQFSTFSETKLTNAQLQRIEYRPALLDALEVLFVG